MSFLNVIRKRLMGLFLVVFGVSVMTFTISNLSPGDPARLIAGDRATPEIVAHIRADLGLDQTLSRACQHPGNLWSLHGLYECLTRRGEQVESLHIKQQLDKALARAEVPVHASCYCRQQAAA